MKQHISVAIDGPSGAGKSTIARTVAAELGYIYVDTGALYRAIGLAASRQNISGEDHSAICHLLPDIQLSLQYAHGAQRVILNGEDVGDAIRTPEIARYASQVSAIPAVRTYLLHLQRDLAERNDVIMDGRDIGTVVLPDARVKIFLTASAQTRAERRWAELHMQDPAIKLHEVLAQMQERDAKDEQRETAPLCQAEDAVRLDTSRLSFTQSVEAVQNIICAATTSKNKE